MSATTLRLGVLDLSIAQTSLELARRVEDLGYVRYWIAEHHGEGGVTNPMLLVPLVASHTKRMQVGTAGVLLRFQSALSVAENFRTMSRLFEGRVEVGLARSPSATDAQTRALLDGRCSEYSWEDHVEKVTDVRNILYSRLPAAHPLEGEQIDPPIVSARMPSFWIHSTSVAGARLAAAIGSHYSFHHLYDREGTVGPVAVDIYRSEFRSSPELARPSWTVTVGGYCARDDSDANDARGRLVPPQSSKPFIIGTARYWQDALGEIARTYHTNQIVLQTLSHRFSVNRQLDSFARIAERALSSSCGIPCNP